MIHPTYARSVRGLGCRARMRPFTRASNRGFSAGISLAGAGYRCRSRQPDASDRRDCHHNIAKASFGTRQEAVSAAAGKASTAAGYSATSRGSRPGPSRLRSAHLPASWTSRSASSPARTHGSRELAPASARVAAARLSASTHQTRVAAGERRARADAQDAQGGGDSPSPSHARAPAARVQSLPRRVDRSLVPTQRTCRATGNG